MYQDHRFSGENHPCWKENVKLTCIVCGKTFSVLPSSVEDRKTCSQECQSIYFSNKFSGEGNPMYGTTGRITYPKPYSVKELDHKVRSSWEEEIGLLLKNNDINYLGYEAKTFEFNGTTYTPDFFITKKIIVEVKGPLFDFQKKKYYQFMEKFPEITFIIVGNGGENPQEICDTYISWEEREQLIPVLKNLLS